MRLIRILRKTAGMAAFFIVVTGPAFAQVVTTPVGAPQGTAAASVSLTRDAAVRRGVQNNPDLAIVQMETQVEAARVGESRTAFTPLFSTVLGRSSTANPPSNAFL